jgi:predicted nucleic acid-binding Zn finger protein
MRERDQRAGGVKRSIITLEGNIAYRTKNFPDLSAAHRFVKCLGGNSRFVDIEMQQSRFGRYFVTFRPASEERQADLTALEQDKRNTRAIEKTFEFWRDPDNRRLYHCFSVASGETYQITPEDCTCPDWQYRCKKAGIRCKHEIALRMYLRAEKEASCRE